MISHNNKSIRINVQIGHGGIRFTASCKFITVDKENYYISKGGFTQFSAFGGKISFSTEDSKYPDGIIIPRKYVISLPTRKSINIYKD